ncbi:MAG: hypothetical protein ACI82A_001543 [Candidatus Azotimanducaceae bacterium]|jgi:hypothetical protein
MVNHMNLPNPRILLRAVLICAVSMFATADDINVSKMDVAKMDVANTDSLFKEIQRTVAEVDFVGMAAAYHVDAVLVNAKSTASISGIMPQWKASGEKLQSEGSQASVAFRFTSRQQDSTSAFDRGIFRYTIKGADGVEKSTFVHFENLAVFRDGRWLTLMERQTDATDVSAWNSLPISW